MFEKTCISAELLADITSVSKATLDKWERDGKLTPLFNARTAKKEYAVSELMQFEAVNKMLAPASNKRICVLCGNLIRLSCLQVRVGWQLDWSKRDLMQWR